VDDVPFGYHGSYLRIDVTAGSAEHVSLPEPVLRQFIGGSGLGVRLLLDEGKAHAEPLAPEAPLVFAFSPLVGSPLTTSAKFAVVSKSPLTERINDSLASSGFAIAGKGCGCDAIVLVGRAPELSVLIIDEGFAMQPSLTMDAMPDAAAAGRCSEPRISRRSRCAELNARRGRTRVS
jgi:aldehyde:ferredoxin oxidoreductase